MGERFVRPTLPRYSDFAGVSPAHQPAFAGIGLIKNILDGGASGRGKEYGDHSPQSIRNIVHVSYGGILAV